MQAVGGVSPHSQAFAWGLVLTELLSERPPADPSWMDGSIPGAAGSGDPAAGEAITQQMAQGLPD